MSNYRLSLHQDAESGEEINRRRSLVRHDRAPPNDRSSMSYHYAQVVNQERDHLWVNQSAGGPNSTTYSGSGDYQKRFSRDTRGAGGMPAADVYDSDGIPLEDFSSSNNDLTPEEKSPSPGYGGGAGREMYGLNDELAKGEHATTRTKSLSKKNKKKPLVVTNSSSALLGSKATAKKKAGQADKKMTVWQAYCHVITFWAPGPLLKLCGFPNKSRQFAWREKVALITVILYIAAFIAYITFGFTATVCKASDVRLRNNKINTGYLIINGRAYDLTSSSHPAAAGITNGANVLYPPINAGGKDASFLFQNVNGNCKGLITPRDNCSIPYDNDDLAWYMPCNLFAQDGSTSANFTVPYYDGWACHTSTSARDAFYSLDVTGDVYFTWDDIKNSSRNLVVYSGDVLDMDLVNWLLTDDVDYPELFDSLRDDEYMKGHDVSMVLSSSEQRQAAKCLSEIVKVGVIDSTTLGCIASKIVLVTSLVLILGVLLSKFFVACYFKWVIAKRQGYNELSVKDMQERARITDNWADADIYTTGPVKDVQGGKSAHQRNQSRMSMFTRGSRMSLGGDRMFDPFGDDAAVGASGMGGGAENASGFHSKYVTMGTQLARYSDEEATKGNKRKSGFYNSNNDSGLLLSHTRNSSVLNPFDSNTNLLSMGGDENHNIQSLAVDLIHPDIVPQPPSDYEPYNYPLAHTICLVTAYSEDMDGLRTTMDSISTSDFPNSHKLIFVVCDGLVKGSGNDQTTPDIVLDMMTDFTVPRDEVQLHSYVSVAQGTKRHNMAKVYAGFYKYDDSTIPVEKQQRVPVVTIVKHGTPDEMTAAKPGNRGKRDSQIILMSFLQKVMFDERMTALEFEIFLNIWKITGLMAEMYEIVLMVDADTRVYPDSLTHMVAEMVKNPDVMGLCGETKISNKAQSWVTAIQVFEYYISHHQSKAFESVFGSVTCLPGCFCMYRIKAPKGRSGYWVPILANPDIVERYSEHVVETLHEKNLLLLGEDRYLSSLMLRTFPKRKQVFVPKAACKTVVPDTFAVLLSQRRRWINSTVHNLMELALIKDLCGTFCFSMQFVITIELIGTLILPAAIAFTFYVIIFAIVSTPTPVLTLCLLGVVFGAPALLVVVTVSNWMYLVWMLCYLVALPIWNFVLPAYAYWKFDDFSWGDTRKTSTDSKGGHDESEGEFDGSKIVQKRWREFERDRRRYSMATNKNNNNIPAAWNPSSSQLNLAQ